MTNEELWRAALGEIELSISKANFSTWFKNTSILSIEKGSVTIGVPNGFAKEWLENKYRAYVLNALRNFQNEIGDIRCIISVSRPESDLSGKTPGADRLPGHKGLRRPTKGEEMAQKSLYFNLNPRYIFESFIVGENNELARAACYAVSQNLGRIYNPLFIYGGVGLGKTHLLQSIGNEVVRQDSGRRVKYTTLEKFANELIESIKNQTIGRFKEDYQKTDLLIIDDVQFLQGKEKTQHEFFHIFNSLYQLNRQIVISSDRPPKAIPALEERLRSRFEGGMIADIGRPDLETRMAILESKVNEKGLVLENEIVRYVAENVKNNIRELEGALNRIVAESEFSGREINLEFVKKSLSDILSSGKRKGVQFQHIVEAVSGFYKIDGQKLVSKGRQKELSRARQVAMYLMRSELRSSYPGIGQFFGGRDHTTALHAYEKINRDMETDERLREEIDLVKEKIYSLD